MVTGITLAPLALEPTTFNVGDTVRVSASFKYTVGVNKTVKLFAGPYYTNLFGKHLVDQCVGDDGGPIEQIGGGQHHHGRIGSPRNCEGELVA